MSEGAASYGNTTVRMILNECIPLFNILMDLEHPSKQLIHKV